MVRDLEELTLRVRDPEARAYIAEAVRCYHAAAYRAAVVVAFAAGMDDLRRKLGALAASGSASADLKAAGARVEALAKQHKPFETEVLAAARDHAELLSVADHQKLDAIQRVRNICAHPSGHHGSPEEARDAIASVVDLLLARPGLYGVAAAKDLVGRATGQAAFFGAANDRLARLEIATQEVRRLETASHAALVAEIIRALDERHALEEAKRAAVPAPARRLVGLVPDPAKELLPSPEQETLATLYAAALVVGGNGSAARAKLPRLINASWGPRVAPIVLSFSPEMVAQLEPDERARVVFQVGTALGVSDVSMSLLRAWIENGLLGAEDQSFLLERVEHAIKRKLDPRVLRLGWSEVDRVFFRLALGSAASTSWSAANNAISVLQGLDETSAQRAAPDERWSYLKALLRQRRRKEHSADQARNLFGEGLGPRSDWLAAVVAQPLSEATSAELQTEDWAAVTWLAAKSGCPVSTEWLLGSTSRLDADDKRAVARTLREDHGQDLWNATRAWLATPDEDGKA